MATFDVSRDGATYRVTVPDDQADGMTPERILSFIDQAQPAPPTRPGQLRVQGIPNPVSVDPSFGDLTAEQQATAVEHIRAEWDRQQRSGRDSAQPTGAGFSALQHGARQGARGLAATARVMGDALDNDWLRRQGRELDDAVPEPRGYVPSGPELVRAIREGRYGDAASNLPGAVTEAIPGMGAAIAAGVAGAAVGGPVAGLAAAGMTSAAQSFGGNAEERAERDGVAATDPGNMLAAAGTTAATAALDAVGARGVGRVVTAPRGLTERVAGAAHASAREGVTEGAQDVVEQTGTTLGTRDGWSVDPAEVAAAAATGVGAGGAVRLPGAVTRGAAESAVDAASAAGEFRNMTGSQAAAVVRVGDVLQREQAAIRDRTGSDPDPVHVLNTARGDLATELRARVRQAEDAGWLDQQRQREGTTVRELIAEAEHQDRELGSGLDRLDALSRAPAEFRTSMRDLLTDLDVMSRASRPGNTGGLFERVGRVVGGASGLAAGVGAGPVGVAMSALAAAGGTTIGARAGAGIGRTLDRRLGGDALSVVQARRRAAAVLRKSGTEAGSNPVSRAALRRLLTDDRLSSRAALGLATDPDTLAKQATEAAARKVAAREAAQQEAEVARHVAMTDGSPELDARVRRARATAEAREAAEARVATEVARDVGTETAARIRAARRAAIRQQQQEDRGTETDTDTDTTAAEVTDADSGQTDAVAAARRRVAKASARRGTQNTVAEAPAASAPSPLPQVQPTSETPPVGLPGTPRDGLDIAPMGGGRRYVRSVLFSKGDTAPTTDADIDAAVGRLADAGTLMPDEADALKATRGDWPRALAQHVAIEVARVRGYDPRDLPDVVASVGIVGTPGAGFYRPDVRDPAAWQGAADARQDHVRVYRDQALAAEDYGLAESLARFGTNTDRQLTTEQRKVIARAVVKAALPEHVALRRAAMAPWLEGRDFDEAP